MELHEVVCWGLIVLSLGFFVLLINGGAAPYGRHMGANFKFIPQTTIDNRAAWVVQEMPNLLWVGWSMMNSDDWRCKSWPNVIVLLLFSGHYVNRTLVYPFQITKKPFPVFVAASAFLFTSVNGYIQVLSLTKYGPCLDNSWLHHPLFLAGVALFFLGMYTNIRSDNILSSLRKPGESGYKIPNGFAFEYVSAANLFGEILEWTGYAMASRSLGGVAFAIATFCNLAPRAIDHHKWYKREFKDKYPSNRKAVIPYLL
eukprot:TRINITY_DN9398_c0_g1_i1.p1 TRINITY_DN9398_c0_g1~~TRINITY_DN9398_c0_g1_i1.p1  ORF type:complete len:257 (-),score=44.30 TRINITY_DN9398_c0_g1_i1:43-813(-)